MVYIAWLHGASLVSRGFHGTAVDAGRSNYAAGLWDQQHGHVRHRLRVTRGAHQTVVGYHDVPDDPALPSVTKRNARFTRRLEANHA